MIKQEISMTQKFGIHVIENGRSVKTGPWIGDGFALLYDNIMRCSVFPQKFGSDMQKHNRILRKALADCENKRVLEIGTGSGSAAAFLSPSNTYSGLDVSPGLLRIAIKKFRKAAFHDANFYLTGAEELPFENDCFDSCLCILVLNFLPDLQSVISEIKRVLVPGGVLVGAVPVPAEQQLSG